MSDTTFIDRAIVASFEYRSRRKPSGSLDKEGKSCQELITAPLSGSRNFCYATNTSYADPPNIHLSSSLIRKIHCGAVLLMPGSPTSAAT
jgi:hypothetical protein